jgi:hypothetical protein
LLSLKAQRRLLPLDHHRYNVMRIAAFICGTHITRCRLLVAHRLQRVGHGFAKTYLLTCAGHSGTGHTVLTSGTLQRAVLVQYRTAHLQQPALIDGRHRWFILIWRRAICPHEDISKGCARFTLGRITAAFPITASPIVSLLTCPI